MKNKTDPAIRIRRNSDYDKTNDDFPTPPWAVRAFFEYVAPELMVLKSPTVLEPACGRGHMVNVLRDLKFKVKGYDKFDYKVGFSVADYCAAGNFQYDPHDIMFTNPPYKFANQFAQRGLKEARIGVALLMRTIWMEGIGRYVDLFKPMPPTAVFVFSRRMNAAQGRLVRGNGAAMSHSWFWWDKRNMFRNTRLGWIPPEAQRLLEREEDYR